MAFEAGEIQSEVPSSIVALVTPATFPRREQNASNPCGEGASSRFWNKNKLSEALKHGGSEGEKVVPPRLLSKEGRDLPHDTSPC